MIRSFGNRLADDLFNDRMTKSTRGFPPMLRSVAQRKLQYLNVAAKLEDLKQPPGNRLEALKGEYAGLYSIRINEQWRVVFEWNQGPVDVSVVDYH